jgi:outer membrane protein
MIKNTFKTILILGISLLTFQVWAQKKPVSTTSSSEQKIGVVNTDSVLMNLKEFPTQIKIMEAFQKQLTAELEVKTLEFDTKLSDYQSKEKGISDQQRQQLLADLQSLDQQIQQLKQSAQQKVMEKERELLTPLNKKIMQAIDIVAKKFGYTHISDLKNFYFVNPSFDVTKMVIEEANKL